MPAERAGYVLGGQQLFPQFPGVHAAIAHKIRRATSFGPRPEPDLKYTIARSCLKHLAASQNIDPSTITWVCGDPR